MAKVSAVATGNKAHLQMEVCWDLKADRVPCHVMVCCV